MFLFFWCVGDWPGILVWNPIALSLLVLPLHPLALLVLPMYLALPLLAGHWALRTFAWLLLAGGLGLHTLALCMRY